MLLSQNKIWTCLKGQVLFWAKSCSANLGQVGGGSGEWGARAPGTSGKQTTSRSGEVWTLIILPLPLIPT
jgi:hypothetical protein